MKRFAVRYGDDHGYMVFPSGTFAEVSAASFEEAAEKLGLKTAPGSRCIVVPAESIRETVMSLVGHSFDKFEEYVMQNLVLVEE